MSPGNLPSVPVEPELPGVETFLPAVFEPDNFSWFKIGGRALKDAEAQVFGSAVLQFLIAAVAAPRIMLPAAVNIVAATGGSDIRSPPQGVIDQIDAAPLSQHGLPRRGQAFDLGVGQDYVIPMGHGSHEATFRLDRVYRKRAAPCPPPPVLIGFGPDDREMTNPFAPMIERLKFKSEAVAHVTGPACHA